MGNESLFTLFLELGNWEKDGMDSLGLALNKSKSFLNAEFLPALFTIESEDLLTNLIEKSKSSEDS